MYRCFSISASSIDEIPSKHAGVISLFDKEFVKKGIFPKALSKDFHKAFELRQVSDYRTTKLVKKEQAEQIWSKAVHFVDSIKKYLKL